METNWRVNDDGSIENTRTGAFYAFEALMEEDTILHESKKVNFSDFFLAYLEACKLKEKKKVTFITYY
jgi:hypothetical protein